MALNTRKVDAKVWKIVQKETKRRVCRLLEPKERETKHPKMAANEEKADVVEAPSATYSIGRVCFGFDIERVQTFDNLQRGIGVAMGLEDGGVRRSFGVSFLGLLRVPIPHLN